MAEVTYSVFQPEARRRVRAAALDYPPKNSQKNAYSAYSEYNVLRSFCSFCFREQNERNAIPFIPKTE